MYWRVKNRLYPKDVQRDDQGKMSRQQYFKQNENLNQTLYPPLVEEQNKPNISQCSHSRSSEMTYAQETTSKI